MTKTNCNRKVCTKCGKEKDLKEFYKSKRFGHSHWCKQCFYLNEQERKAKDPLRVSEQNKKKTKAWYQKNGREYMSNRWRTKERYREQVNDHKKTPKGKTRVARYNAKRRKLSKDDPTLTYEQEVAILKQQHNKCRRCGRTFSGELPYTRDHIYPLSKGGKLVMGNVQLLCRSCNSIKRDHI
jgi:hypothetical protein